MADNIQLNLADTVGNKIATAQLTMSGDTADVQIIGIGVLSGSEAAWTYTHCVSGAGTATGALRTTLASDDPAVAKLTTIDTDTGNIAAGFAAHGADVDGKTGVMVQLSTGTASVNAKGDADGHAQVDVLSCASHAVTNAGTFAVQSTLQAGTAIAGKVYLTDGTDDATVRDVTGAKALDVAIVDASGNQITTFGGSGGTSATDDAAFTAGSGTGTPMMGFYTTDTVNSGDVGVLKMDANRHLYVETRLGQASATAPTLGVALQGVNTGETYYLLCDTDGHLQIDVLSCASHAVTNAGTFAVQVTGDALTALQLIDNAVSGAGFNITQFAGAAVPIGAGTEAAALRVTLATDSTGVVSIDDNGGAITVDGTVAVTGMTACNTGAVVLAAGSAAIGKLAANSGVDIGDVDVTSIAAGTATIGGVISQSSSSAAYDGTTSCTIKRFNKKVNADDTEVIPAPTGTKKVLIRSLSIMALSTTISEVYLETATSSSALLGDSTDGLQIALDADGNNIAGTIWPCNPDGWFKAANADEAINIRMSSGQAMWISGTYIEVT